MAAMREVESEDAVVGVKYSGVCVEIRGRSREGLNFELVMVRWRRRVLLTLYVDAPLRFVQAKSLESSLLTKSLGLINVFVASVVSCAWVTFRVLVCMA
jgi:hypothetical protein